MTQKERVLRRLQQCPKKGVTSMDGYLYFKPWIVDIRKRISELRRDGYEITDEKVKGINGNYKRYVLKKGEA